jgi:ferrous iron transport protein A
MIRLSELAVGQKAVIHSFEKDEIFIKLMEMGCVPGEKVKIEQIAPLGDPDLYFCGRLSFKPSPE